MSLFAPAAPNGSPGPHREASCLSLVLSPSGGLSSSPPGRSGSSSHLRVKVLSGVETQTTGSSCPAGPGVFLHGLCPDLGAGARVPSEMEEGTLMAGQHIRAPQGGSWVTWTCAARWLVVSASCPSPWLPQPQAGSQSVRRKMAWL